MNKRNFLQCVSLFLSLLAASSLQALSPKDLSLFDSIASSDAVVVGRVTSVDETISSDMKAPLTEVRIVVSEVLHGSVGNSQELRMRFRGGLTPDGRRQRFSSVPSFIAGTEYVMFLRGDYYVSPLVPTMDGLLRAATDGNKKIAVNSESRAIHASARYGLMRGAAIKYPNFARVNVGGEAISQASVDQAQDNSGVVTPSGEPEPQAVTVEPSTFEETLDVIRGTAAQVQLQMSVTARATMPLPEFLTPLPLPE